MDEDQERLIRPENVEEQRVDLQWNYKIRYLKLKENVFYFFSKFASKCFEKQGAILFGLIGLIVELVHQFRNEDNPSQMELTWLDLISSVIAYSIAIVCYGVVIYRIRKAPLDGGGHAQYGCETTSSFMKIICLVAGVIVLISRFLRVADYLGVEHYRRAIQYMFFIAFNFAQLTFIIYFLVKENAVAVIVNNSRTKYIFPRIAMGVSIFTVIRNMLYTINKTLNNIPEHFADDSGDIIKYMLNIFREPVYNCIVVFEILNCCFVFGLAQNVQETIQADVNINWRYTLLVRGCQLIAPIVALTLAVLIRCIAWIPPCSALYSFLPVVAGASLCACEVLFFMNVVVRTVVSSPSLSRSSQHHRTLMNYLGLSMEVLFSCVGIVTYARSWNFELFSNLFFVTNLCRLTQASCQSTMIMMASNPVKAERTTENGIQYENNIEYKPTKWIIEILLIANSISLIFNFMDSQLASMPGNITVEKIYSSPYWAVLFRAFSPLVIFYRVVSIDQMSQILLKPSL